MSYARFGDDCDLYVYPHAAGGITIHVASHRLVYSRDHPPPNAFELSAVEERVLPAAFARFQRLLRESRQNASREAIGGSYDGETFYALSPREAARIVTLIEGAGYLVPEELVGDLLEEDFDDLAEDSHDGGLMDLAEAVDVVIDPTAEAGGLLPLVSVVL